MSIPLVQDNNKDSINTSIIAIKRNIERINMLLGLVDSGSPDLSGLATKQELEDAITQVETDLAPVDEVTSGNMQSVTSNAVAVAIQNQKIFFQNTNIGTFTLASNQTVSPDITQYTHTPPSGYTRLCSLYSYGQNYYQMSVNFTSTKVFATITNYYDYLLTTDVYLFEIFMPSNILP